MTPTPFDFRKPPPGELERHTASWIGEACHRAAIAWAKLLPFVAVPELGGVQPVTSGDGMTQLAPGAIGFPLSATATTDDGFLFAIPRPLFLTLLGGITGDVTTEGPKDRNLTPLEVSLSGYLIRELFLTPLESAWPLPDPWRLTVGTGGVPRTVWRVAASDPALLATLNVLTQFGEHQCHILFPRSLRLMRLTDPPPPKASPLRPVEREHIESLVREMAVDFAVTLGTADLTLYDLAKLEAGDLIVLKQKVSDPLAAMVSGQPKYRVWPGAIGSRQAVQVQTTQV